MERLSESQLQNFLREDENTSLDFKSKPYAFSGADDNKKSELLKDILAFSNAWREKEAYIVIGIKEIKGSKNEILGLNHDEPFDDAHLQQFINGKTNKKITLAYETYELENQSIGIIRIPIQKRPIYSKRDFGTVKKETLYYRLGSSTEVAKPQDIYDMGKYDHSGNKQTPILDFQFINPHNKEQLGRVINEKNISFAEPVIPLHNAHKRKQSHNGLYLPELNINQVNSDYWRQLEKYHRMGNLLQPLQFSIKNESNYLAHNVHIEIQDKSADKIIVKTNEDFPNKPSSGFHTQIFNSIVPQKEQLRKKNIHISIFNGEWNVRIEVGDIKPKSTVYADIFYIGATESITRDIKAFIYASNLPEPQIFDLNIKFDVEQRSNLTIEKLRELYDVDSEIK